jgi:multiple sugar transport system ATP-binding protein
MASLSVHEVRKSFGKAEIVRGVSLEVRDGELVSLVGPSGCGKSTLLHLVAGLEAPSSGSIRIGGVDVTRASPGARNVAMVFQSYALYPHRSVRRNISFPLEVARVGRAERDARVEETAARLGIAALLDRSPRELSGGQRQRVALARALVRRPAIYLFDEPLSNLDAALRADLRAELKRLHAELGATFVYVTHDQAEAMTLSDRVVVLDRGVVRQVGPPREIYDHPADTFVATFLGAPRMNLVPSEVLGLRPGELAGLRPEDAIVADDGALAGSIYVVEPMGADTWVTVDLGAARIVARAPGSFASGPGARVRVAFDAARVVRFDGVNGKRVGGS